ncbi:MAG: transposase [Christensenellales bacterium]
MLISIPFCTNSGAEYHARKSRNQEKKLKERKCLSEHPFGTVKWHHGAYYLLCKGKEKVSAELGLSFLAYNLKRALNIAGFDKLLAAIKG